MPHTGPTRSLTLAQQEEIHRLRAEGLSFRNIARATGVPAATVQRYVRTPGRRDAWDLDEQPYGPDQHQLAKQALGLKYVDDTFVLSPAHDPFYSGKPAQIRDGQWYGQLWRDLGMPDGGHARRVHYKADAVGALKPDGTVYQNNDADWAYLLGASIPARSLGYLDPEAVTDRRSRGVSANVSAMPIIG